MITSRLAKKSTISITTDKSNILFDYLKAVSYVGQPFSFAIMSVEI